MDDIQRKLELIDKQLTGGFINSYKRIIGTAPLLFAAVGLITGILIQDVFGLSISIWIVVLAICAASTVLLFAAHTRDKFASYKLLLLSFCALIGFTCLGAVRLNSYEQPRQDDIRNFVAEEQKLATIRGAIVTKPYINRNRGWEFARFKFTDPYTSFYLKVREAETVDGWAKVSGTVRVQVAEPVLDLKAGDYIQAYCWLDRFKGATNPGQFDVAKYLARKNIFIAASVKSQEGIELLESEGKGTFVKIKGRMREAATKALLGDLSIEERNRGLLEALLLGYRGNINSATYEAFRKTGLLHFISLSGLHLGILAGIIWWLCKTAGLLKRARAIICIIAIAVFLMIVPPRAPTLRAAIIVFVFCISIFFRRPPNPVNTLSLAAIILLLIKPVQLFGAGWQLSFATVLALLLFCQRIYFFFYESITDVLSLEKLPKLVIYLLELFSTGLTAWLGGAGILLYHFYTISPLTSIWTVIVFPFVAGILTFGFLKIILSFLLPTVAALLGVIVNFLSDSLIWIVKLLAHLDISQILIGHVPVTMIILYYCFVLFAGFIYFRRPLIKKAICTAMVLAMIAFLGVTKWQRTHRDNLEIACLDVGHGQAILAQLPGKATILFDAGSLHKNDVGRRIVAPFLDYSGINKINSIIISHNDVDHINGIPEIAEHCEVSGVYANDAFFSKTDRWGTARFLEESLSKKGLEIQRLGKELSLSSKVKIKILWPTKRMLQNEELGDNDKSVVSLIEFAGTKILLCSDIEKFAQRELLRLNPNLKADVVVVPHHGLSRTLSPDFLKKLDAKILICSCSRSDYENNRIVKPKSNAERLCTVANGIIAVCIDKDGMIK
jgi:competence protein ComEC